MNDRKAQKIHSNFSNRQSILSGMIHWKIVTYAGLTNETTFIFRKLGIWRRHKQDLCVPWHSIDFHQSMTNRWKIYYCGRCLNMKRRHNCHCAGLTKNYWIHNRKQIHAGNRESIDDKKTSWIFRENVKYALRLNMTLTGVAWIGLWNFSRCVKSDRRQGQHRTRKRSFEKNI